MLSGLLQGLKLKEARAYNGRVVRGLDWRAPKTWPARIQLIKLPDGSQCERRIA